MSQLIVNWEIQQFFKHICLNMHPVEKLLFVVNYALQGAQDESVDVNVEVDFIMVVLHREDAVHRKTHSLTYLLHLHFKNQISVHTLQLRVENK